MIAGLIVLQFLIVVFIALHDWVPLGRLNNLKAVHAADSPGKLVTVTAISTLPFAIGLAGSVYYSRTGFPEWLIWFLWITYGLAVYGMLRAWWLPYLLIPNPVRAARYQAMFGGTHAFLPRRNGIRPNTLHVGFHLVLIATAVLLVAATVR
jgi:hypothetical protein